MMDKDYKGTGFIVVGVIVGALLMWSVMTAIPDYKKKTLNLKCVQGELYEEIRPNMFVKSHLECFEQRTF
jgi:hypothetical protein